MLTIAPLVAQSQYGYGYGYGSQMPPQAAQPQYPQQYGQPGYDVPDNGWNQGSGQRYAQQPYSGQSYAAQPYAGQPETAQPYAGQPYAQQPDPGQPDAAQPYADQGQGADYGAQQPAQPPLSADQLEQLVAPIALYPDGLVAQILTASTYPAQIAVADQWLQQMQAQGYGSPEQIEEGANAQNWDPSVRALTAFPQVLDWLNQNLQWTTELGDAYYNQPQDVMQTVQVMRERAQSAGTLENSPQLAVTDDPQGDIEVAPPDPEYVYVPEYDPWTSYGMPLDPYPGFSMLGGAGLFFAGAPVRMMGFAVSAFLHAPWGWLGWGLDWRGHSVLFNRGAYFTHSASVRDWGFPAGGPRAYGAQAYRSARGGNQRGWDQPARSGYDRPYQGWGRSPQSFVNRGGQAMAQPGRQYASGINRSYGTPERSDNLPATSSRFAYNRPLQIQRPQAYAYSRPGNSYGYGAQSQRAMPYASSRAPQTFQRAFAQAPALRFTEPGRSGELFGGGRQSRGFQSAPRSYGGGRASGMGRGHSFGGGHASSRSGGRSRR